MHSLIELVLNEDLPLGEIARVGSNGDFGFLRVGVGEADIFVHRCGKGLLYPCLELSQIPFLILFHDQRRSNPLKPGMKIRYKVGTVPDTGQFRVIAWVDEESWSETLNDIKATNEWHLKLLEELDNQDEHIAQLFNRLKQR